MLSWIFSTQSNVVPVFVAACSLFFLGDNAVSPDVSKADASVKPIEASLLVTEDLSRSIRFHSLVAQWHAERSELAWVSEMAICPAYQKIIGMGISAVPLILQQMEVEYPEPDHWFWALRSITDFDPVPNEDRGDILKMAAAWISWGKLTGYAR